MQHATSMRIRLLVQDVVTFLSWAAEPEMDDRKLMGAKFITVLSLCLITAVYYKRWKWAPLKSRRCGSLATFAFAHPHICT